VLLEPCQENLFAYLLYKVNVYLQHFPYDEYVTELKKETLLQHGIDSIFSALLTGFDLWLRTGCVNFIFNCSS